MRVLDTFPLLDWIVSRRVHEYLDAAGRPVGEGRSTAFQHLQTEMRTCPYSGSRYHHAKPMNATALVQMPPWPQVLTMLGWLSQRYFMRHNRAIIDSNDLAQVTSAGVWLADFLVLRRHKPLGSHEIPVLISALYKVCLGFQLAYLADRFTEDSATELPGAAGFLAYLEDHELLIGEAEVCSGSPAMILQAYEAIMGGQAVAEDDLPAPCSTLEIAWDDFDAFTAHADRIWRDLVIYAMRMPEFLPRLLEPELPVDLQERLDDSLHRRGMEILAGQHGLLVDIARAAQGAAVETPAMAEPARRAVTQPGSLSDTVFAWLTSTVGPEMEPYAPTVARALQVQLTSYEAYEAAVLAGLNQHLNSIMQALGFESGAPLTPTALSHVCGRTLRDWYELS